MRELDEGTIIHELLELSDFRVGGGYMRSASLMICTTASEKAKVDWVNNFFDSIPKLHIYTYMDATTSPRD